MLSGAPHSLQYFDNGEVQCWHNASICCLAFTQSVRDYLNNRDSPAQGTPLFHLNKWMIAFDGAMRLAFNSERKAATHAFNALRGTYDRVPACVTQLRFFAWTRSRGRLGIGQEYPEPGAGRLSRPQTVHHGHSAQGPGLVFND